MISKWVRYGIFNTFILQRLQCRVTGHMHDKDGAAPSRRWVNERQCALFFENAQRMHRIATLSPFKKMLVLVITAGQSGWPRWLFICCSGTPHVADVARGHLHFQCSSDTICFLYFLAQRKRLRKQFNREREHTQTSTMQIEAPGDLLCREHRLEWVLFVRVLIQEVHFRIQWSSTMAGKGLGWFLLL